MTAILTPPDIRELTKASGLLVTIMLATAASGRERLESPVRLKNELYKAHRLLVEAGMRSTLAWDLLDPAKKLIEEEDFWMASERGLALFFAEDRFHWLRTPFALPELTVVGPKFHLRPLLPLLESLECYVLALDEKQVRFLRVSTDGFRAVHVPDMPLSLKEALGPEYSEKQRQMHSVGTASRPSAVSHGAGDRAADQKDRDLRFSQAVDRAVVKHLATSAAPLVLAATEPLLSIYRGATHYSHLSSKALTGWPGRTTDEDLANEASGLLSEIRAEHAHRVLDRYLELKPAGKTLLGIDALVPAALSGRVQTLLADKSALQWGFVDSDGHPQRVESQVAWSEDLINRAAIETLANGGEVVEFEGEQEVQNAGVLGTLRY